MLKSIPKPPYHGFAREEFTCQNRLGVVIRPHTPQAGNPYIWRTEFLGAFDAADIAMLKRGWHLVYYQVSDMYGAPQAISLMHDFQLLIEQEYQLAHKATLFGFSRGGLYAVNYAAAYPQKVQALYLDAPVLDIFSWPAGFGKGRGATAEWEQCKSIYGISDSDRNTFHGNPLDKLDILLSHRIPILLVAGDADEVVPFEENGKLLYADYTYRHGNIKLIVKPGAGHHPHSLEDPQEIVDFLMQKPLGVIIENGPQDWQIVQQEDGYGHFALSGYWIDTGTYAKPQVYLRVVQEDTGLPVIHWTACHMEQMRWDVQLKVPAGGLYRIETCLEQENSCSQWAMRGDIIHHIGVGDVFIIAGQSNVVGYGKDYISDPPELGVHILKNSGQWALASHPLGDSTKTAHTQNMDNANTSYSPYLQFGKYLKRHLGYPIGLIQTALGGSFLSQWEPGTGILYQNMMQIIGSQKIKGMLWYQGCSDTAELSLAQTYYDRFMQMVQAIRLSQENPSLPILTCQLNHCVAIPEASPEENTGWALVRESQRQAALQENIYIVPTNDCTLSDQIHNSAASCLMIGERLARTALHYIYGKDEITCDAPNIQHAVRTTDHQITLQFINVYGYLCCYDHPDTRSLFCAECDGKQFRPVACKVPADDTIELTFDQPIAAGALIHGGFEKNLSGTMPFDTATGLPILSFYAIPVECEL